MAKRGGLLSRIIGRKPLAARAHYDAARISRRTAGWFARSSGPNAEIAADLVTLRNRHRDLCRNNPWVRRAVQALVTNTVGPGIRAQWENEERQARWSAWWESTDCDADGRLNGYGLQALIFRTVAESGECLVRARPRRPEDGLSVPLQLQVLEPDYLDHTKTEILPNGWISQGVEFGPFGRRRAYWLHRDHPGEYATRSMGATGTSERYPADQILHIYRADRPGQVRGVVWGTGAMTRARMLDDYQDAQLERHRLAACFMAFVRDTDLADPGDTDADLLDKLEPGAIEILPSGKDMLFASPPQPENDKEFQLAILRAVAADYGIPYEVLTGDLSEVNFSSARMGWNEFARNINAWRWQLLEPQLLSPVANWYLEAESVLGIVTDGAKVLWTAPSRTMVDKTREVKPLIEEIRAGLVSLPEAIRQVGYDPLTLITEQADFIDVLDGLGLKLSSVVAHDPQQQTIDTEAFDGSQNNLD